MGEEPLPDWLTEMRGQSTSDESAADTGAEPSLPVSPPPSPPPAPSPPPFTEPDGMPTFEDETEPDRFSQLFADLEPLEPDEDMVGDLRGQIMLSDDDLEDYDQPSFRLPSPIPGLTPPQSLVIALLFFATVALCGCMLLFMTERMVPPW